MMYAVIAFNAKHGWTHCLGEFPTEEEAQYHIDHDIEWEEDDVPEDWDFTIEPVDKDEDDEPWDIDDDCGFDPYMGCYTDDC